MGAETGWQRLLLGIETSCDETAAAVVADGRRILSNVVASQMALHQPFGGVVPEVASRRHVEQVSWVVKEALQQAGVDRRDLSAVAVTAGPGLVGALLVGVAAAKALSLAWQIPLVAVHHIAGHIYANRLVGEMMFPLLALVVSGGHTELILMREHSRYEVIGQTRDDAAGEAYDKVARFLGLPYPGGAELDRLAQLGQPVIPLPRAWLEPGSYDFSFSGLKSAVIQAVTRAEQAGETWRLEDVAASFQAAVVDVLVEKTVQAAQAFHVRQLLLAGGVAANRGLRQALKKRCDELGIPLVVPPLSLCTDNAAMIAAAGDVLFEQGVFAGMDLNAVADLELR